VDVTRDVIRTRCSDAVFERGEQYRSEGRIRTLRQFGETLTATVRGSTDYDVSVDRSGAEIDAFCSCPYDGPGDCKHVVAVLLTVIDKPPTDEGERARTLLEDVPADELQEFLIEAFARDPALYDRFRARFGSAPDVSVDEFRSAVDGLFERHTEDHPVVTEAIDFSEFTDRAETHRDRGYDAAAATIYRALVTGIDENYELIDAAYDYYAQVFQSGLDGYVECAEQAAAGPEEREDHLAFLDQRLVEGSDFLREQYADAIAELEP
jgi:uncharacterized Zn finger protein